MTVQEAIDKYVERFGGYPYFVMMGASNEYIIQSVAESIRTGEEIRPEEGMIY